MKGRKEMGNGKVICTFFVLSILQFRRGRYNRGLGRVKTIQCQNSATTYHHLGPAISMFPSYYLYNFLILEINIE